MPVIAFLVVGSIGLLVLLSSLLLGDLFDGIFHGALEGALDIDSPFLSTSAIAAFCAAFGFTGALAVNAGVSGGLATVLGVLAGGVLGAIAGGVTKALKGGVDGDIPSTRTLSGAEAVVVAAIRPGALGAVNVQVGSHSVRPSATAADLELPVGARVRVTTVLSPTLVEVAPLP